MTLSENALDPIQKERNKDLFINGKDIIKEKVRFYLMDTFLKWFKKMGYDKKDVKLMYIIGSSLGYQYTDVTDVDLHVQVNLTQEKADELGALLPNNNILPGTKRPVQFYLTTNLKDIENGDNAYDILNDKWLKKSNKEDAEIPVSQILEITKFFMAGVEDRLAEYKRDKKELEIYKTYSPEKQEIKKEELDKIISDKENEIKADLDALYIGYHVIKGLRKEVFAEGEDLDFLVDIKIKKPNFSVSNLIYKTLDRFGYLKELRDIMEEREKLIDKKK